MGIDLIENSEMSALSPSRLGNKCFVDDDSYANSVGSFFANVTNKVFGTNVSVVSNKEKAKRTEASTQSINATWGVDATKKNNCNYLELRLAQVSNAITGELSKNPSKTTKQRVVNPLLNIETELKNLVAQNNCVEKREQASKDAEERKNIELINKTANAPIGSLLPDEVLAKKSNTTKYILYGVGGIVLVITTLAILKRK